MNILHLNDKITISGGVEVYIEQLLKYMPQYNIQSHWLGIHKNNKSYSISEYGQTSVTLEVLSFNDTVAYLKQFIAKYSIDIIHIHSISNPQLIDACFKLAPVVRSMHEPRIVCPGHGKLLRKSEEICTRKFGLHCIYHSYKEGCCNRHPKRLIPAIKNTYYEVNKASKKYKCIIAMSDFMKGEAIKAGIHKNKVMLNPYFTENTRQITNVVHTEDKRLLYIGRLSRTKGVHYLINSAISLLDKGHKIIIDIVGDGHDAHYFKSLVPDHLKQYFVFHGWQSRDQINEHLANSYLLLFPSIYPEAFGISGIEAMMHGKPVVGFNVGGVSTWLKEGITGYLVHVKDSDMFSEKITELIVDQKLYAKMCINARQYALEQFSPEVHMKKLINVYNSILSQ
ncbi:glycosyltransferase family 4 protein [Saccharicrinis aurantiacus]|uniref:glycosyltransferase family 4 protein n=1 Tax=Saccharicrinis aurantiacus TaxID=1849719 RepID=UPI002490628F|nr:glycosyltransferase family 4 protein [Saccharicrinis aurantiacus]